MAECDQRITGETLLFITGIEGWEQYYFFVKTFIMYYIMRIFIFHRNGDQYVAPVNTPLKV